MLTAGDGVGTGKVFHYINGKFDYHQRVYRISNFRSDVSGRYFFHQFSRNFLARIESLTAKSSVDSVRMETIAGMEILLPARAEQDRIARTIDDVDELITTLERLIVKKQAIKQGMMQQLFAGKTRCRDLQANLGEISAFITKGATPTTYGFAWESSGVPFLRSECVADGGLDLRQSMYISESANQALRRSQVRDGDLLMTITGNVGRVIRLSGLGTANINQHIARIRIRDTRFDAGYVYHYLSQRPMRTYYESIVTGQAYPQISLKQVRDTKVFAPEVKKQRAIAAALDEADASVVTLQRLRSKYQALKQGMVQELLTGRTRLPVAEGTA